jgi:hypothetical protein
MPRGLKAEKRPADVPLKFTDLRAAIDIEEQNQIAEKRQAIIETCELLSRAPHSI